MNNPLIFERLEDMKFLSVDGGFYKFISRFWDIVKLNFCWLFFSLPLVTVGAATVAVYSVTNKMVDEKEGYICREFWKAFKSNLKQGIPLGLILAGLIYVIWFSFSNYKALDSALLMVGGIVVAFFTVLGFIYAFPLSARYENTLLATIRNSMLISARFLGKTIFLIIILAVEFYLFLWISVSYINLFVLLFGPACFMFTISGIAMRCFRELEKIEGMVTNPEVLEAERKEQNM